MDTREVIESAARHLQSLEGHVFDVLAVTKPVSVEAAVNLAKVISKLSPLVGNMIEINTVEVLNAAAEFRPCGKWVRQDPDFPDTVLKGSISPVPGFEIKAWFPMATEITARFRESRNNLAEDNTSVVLLAWLPEHIIYGKPKIIGVCVASGKSVAAARDLHYHKPPDYLVLEPEDTRRRTRNLQQTNTNGYKFQGTGKQLSKAAAAVRSWGRGGKDYKPTPEYQSKLRRLTSRYPYRLDTNYAKIDRIEHAGIEAFKKTVGGKQFLGMTVNQWARVLVSGDDTAIRQAVKLLGIKGSGAKSLVR
ncbi:MAG TPA: hypothetical protein VN765_04040 [Candidatus Acidoferrum sp.]|nr:hypothetical protein [Candidatus Acidoferrum sp.]